MQEMVFKEHFPLISLKMLYKGCHNYSLAQVGKLRQGDYSDYL